MSDSSFVRKERCPQCGSRNNLARYSDGHAHCFSFNCDYWEPADDGSESNHQSKGKRMAEGLLTGEFAPLTKRGITEETCRKFGYVIADLGGEKVQVAPYFDADKNMIGQKVRWANKEFKVFGTLKGSGLFGQHLWGQGGKKVVVCEGEIDTMTVSQLQGNKWPVVGIQNGAGKQTKKAIEEQLEWLESFEQVIFMFDMDEPGQSAAVACAEALTPGKAAIAHLPLKDPSECLQKGKGQAVIDAIWQAKVYRPDGIIEGSAITKESLKKAQAVGYDIRLPRLNEMIGGLREREITLLTAGSGIGKSTLAREVAYALHQDHGLTIGNVYLEESKEKTAQGYIAIHNDVPLGQLRKNPDLLTDEQWDEALSMVVHQRMYFYDHFGSLDSDHLLTKIKYLRVACGCNFVVLDHISIVVSGQEASTEGERRDIDRLMTKLRSLVEQTGLGIIAIVHLKQPEGKPHEEGGRVTLSQLRGSGSLKQLSDNVIALERDQQGDNRDLSLIRVLKCREFGETSEADYLIYHRDTGRLLPTDKPQMFSDKTQGQSNDF